MTPLPPWRKTSGAGGGPKGQGNAELLPCNEPCWEVTPGTLSRLPKLDSVERHGDSCGHGTQIPLHRHILETLQCCRQLSLHTLWTKRWTKEIFGTSWYQLGDTYVPHHGLFGVLCVDSKLLGLTAPWGKGRPLYFLKEDMGR